MRAFIHRDLCLAISARYKAHRKEKWDSFRAQGVAEVREVTMLIASEGEYPTSAAVRARLSNPGFLRMPTAYAEWKQTLNELGYVE